MITVRLLGQIDVRDARGAEIRSLLRQPKRVALLSYLAMARPHGFHQRDKLFGLLWSESTQGQARHSLNQALHLLRHELGKDAIRTLGDGAVSLAEGMVTTDVVEFEEAIARKDHEAALQAYGGDLMDGFFVSEAPEFELWMHDERIRLKEQAADIAWMFAHECIANNQLSLAERIAQRALLLLPTDESEVRRFIQTLAGAGDTAAAVRFYERFVDRLRDEFELVPSSETQAIAETLRGAAAVSRLSGAAPRSITKTESVGAGSLTAHTRNLRRWPILAAVATAAVVSLVLIGGALLTGRGSGDLDPAKVLVMPFENRTGDHNYDDWGEFASAFITRGIERSSVATVVSNAVVRERLELESDGSRVSCFELAVETGAGTAVRGHYALVDGGRRLRFEGELYDVETSELITAIIPIEGPADSVDAVMAVLVDKVIAAVAVQFDHETTWATRFSNPPSLEAFREYRTGMDLFDRGHSEEALAHLLRAIEIDPLWPPPIMLAGHSYSVIARSTDNPVFAEKRDSVFRYLHSLGDRLILTEQLEVDYAGAISSGDLDADLRVAREMVRSDSPFQGYSRGRSASRNNRPREALEALSKVDTTEIWVNRFGAYWSFYVLAVHQLEDYELELTIARAARRRFPERLSMLDHEVRALISLGRLSEAWRLLEEARSLPPPGTPALSMQVAALEFRAIGHAEEASQALQVSISLFRELLDFQPDARELSEGLANSLYVVGEWDEAESLYARLHADHPHAYRYLGRLGSIVARKGDRDSALAVSESLAAMDWLWRRGSRTAWRARIAAILGDEQGAVSLLRQAIEEGQQCCSWVHTDVDLQLLADYPPFVQLARPKG